MPNINTTYLGLDLKSPLIVGSSPLTENVDSIVDLANAGAGAVVLKSLFEEQILMDVDSLRVNNIHNTFSDAENYFSYFTREKHLNDYLQLIKDCKTKTDIPIIASINCKNAGEWVDFATKMENAGADAIELNIFNIPADQEYTSSDYEKVYFDIIQELSQKISIPISIKVSPYFSGLANFMTRLSYTTIEGIVLFNRFYEPDVDIHQMELKSKSFSSLAADNSQVLRWIGILSPMVKCDLCSSTGVIDGETMIKNMLVGAQAVMVVSQLLKDGPQLITKMNEDLEKWMLEKKFENTKDFIGKLNQKNIRKPIVFERTQFMRYFHDADYVNK